eukprot:457712-Amphidinium_carterae.1
MAWPFMSPGKSLSHTGMSYELPAQKTGALNDRVLRLFPALRGELKHVRVRRMVSQEVVLEPAGGMPEDLLLDMPEELPNRSDWHPPHTDSWDNWYKEKRYGAIISALLYLNDNDSGGNTSFPRVGVEVEPRAGRMVIWRNCVDASHVDPLSYHHSGPMVKGTKWTALWLFSADPRDHCSYSLPSPPSALCVPGPSKAASSKEAHGVSFPP